MGPRNNHANTNNGPRNILRRRIKPPGRYYRNCTHLSAERAAWQAPCLTAPCLTAPYSPARVTIPAALRLTELKPPSPHVVLRHRQLLTGALLPWLMYF